MISQNDITAVILAGGQGKRAGGKDKGRLRFKGKPFVEHLLEIVQPQVKTVVISANRHHDLYIRYGYPVLTDDEFSQQGPLAGILSAMNKIQTPYLLTVPVDMPFLPENLVEQLIKQPRGTEDCIYLAHDGERIQHAIGLIPVALKNDLRGYLEKGERKWQAWIERHPCQLVYFHGKNHSFRNINTLEELDMIERDKQQ